MDSIHYYRLNPSPGGLESAGRPLPTTPGVDAVAVADVDGDTCNDVIAAGIYGGGWSTSATARSASTAAVTSRSRRPRA